MKIGGWTADKIFEIGPIGSGLGPLGTLGDWIWFHLVHLAGALHSPGPGLCQRRSGTRTQILDEYPSDSQRFTFWKFQQNHKLVTKHMILPVSLAKFQMSDTAEFVHFLLLLFLNSSVFGVVIQHPILINFEHAVCVCVRVRACVCNMDS